MYHNDTLLCIAIIRSKTKHTHGITWFWSAFVGILQILFMKSVKLNKRVNVQTEIDDKAQYISNS